MNNFVRNCIFLILGSMYPAGKLLGHMGTFVVYFENCQAILLNSLYHFTILSVMHKGSILSHLGQHLQSAFFHYNLPDGFEISFHYVLYLNILNNY